ncbi:hypothetical protein B296_00032978 [Ensete ventricosum]|uniref:UDP-N-acetylglucosamine transferase subunit ALG14 n=1 Tax=Ensete ventricosum TaxID=4639 RepID=A0A426YSP4_ENSVE|nr:hypothetical protein B296_00032978 [Ensete ventricosum]
MQIYRSREVGQSYIISIGTTLIATAHALWLVIRIRPQVIICNDPGTCIPLCASGFPFKVCITHVTYNIVLTILILNRTLLQSEP